MSTGTGDDGDETGREWTEGWSRADQAAAKDVEQRCGIALVPEGIDD